MIHVAQLKVVMLYPLVSVYMSTDTSSKQCSTRGYKWIHVAFSTLLSPIQDTCRRDKGYKWIQLVSGRHVSGVNASLTPADARESSICVSIIS